MINSPNFCSQIRIEALSLFVVAAKLRNALLFRECLIWIVGPHEKPDYLELTDHKLRRVARLAHGDISIRLSTVQKALWRIAKDDWANDWRSSWDAKLFRDLDHCGKTGSNTQNMYQLRYPWFLRSLRVKSLSRYKIYEGLLESNLVLRKGVYEAGSEDCVAEAGGDDCEDHFLCAEVADEDLPWDINESDW